MKYLKKLLIGLTVLFSFLFASNVNAYSSYTPKSYTNNDFIILNTLALNKEEIYSYANSMPMGNLKSDFISNSIIKLRDYYETNFSNTFDFYIITFRFSSDGLYYSKDGAYLVLFNEDDLTSDINYLSNEYAYSSVTNIYFGQLKNITYIYKTRDANTISKLSDNYGYARWIAGSTGSSQNTQIKMSKYYETNYNFNIYLNTENSIYTYSKLIYNDITYNPGDFLFNTLESNNLNNIKPQAPTEPELDISVIEKTDYLENIKINFNIWDTEKYIYQYKLTGMEVWEDITENDFEYISYSNNTIYIQMIDKTTNESILNATYTFSNITETIPDITFNESIPNSCKILKNGTNYIVCKEIKANFNNYYGINNYLWSYSDDRENWTQIYNDKFIDLISENKAIYFKLYDRYTNETLKYMTYNITGIELIPSDLGQYITFNGKYENNNYKLDIIFYNYDNELYNYYYSTDGENWTQLSLAEMSNYASIYSKYKSFNFYKDMTVYVKIEDKNANYINSATYQIKIPSIELFDALNNLKVDNKILNYFTNIYNQIRTSDLGNYIFMLIVTSIILLIIKSARR